MNFLSVGTDEFHALTVQISGSGHSHASCGPNARDIEDLALSCSFQAVLAQANDGCRTSYGWLEALNRLRPPFTTIGFLNTGQVAAYECPLVRRTQLCVSLSDPVRLLQLQCHAAIHLHLGTRESGMNIGEVAIDFDRQVVYVGAVLVNLSRREYQALELIAVNGRRPTTAEHFLDQVYGLKHAPAPKIFDVLVCKVRRKLRLAGLQSEIIETRWGVGYSTALNPPLDVLRAA